MTPLDLAIPFGIILALAAMPSASVLPVVRRLARVIPVSVIVKA